MKLSRALLITTSLVLLAACSVQGKSGGTTPGEAKDGFMGLSTASDVKTDTEAAFKGQSNVIIGSFQITYLEEKKASAKAGGGLMGNGFGGKSKAHVTLKNITTEQEQAITDAIYTDFIGKLQQAGYTVYDRAALVEHEDFKGVTSDVSPKREESSFFGGDVTQTTIAPTAIGRTYGGGFAFSHPIAGAAGFATKTKTPVLFVNYTVDFANAEGSGGYFSSTSSVEVGQGISIPPGGGVQLIGGQSGTFSTSNGSITLGQPVYSKETFGDVVGTTTDAEAGLEAAVNVIGLLGGIGSNQTRSFDINADPARYTAITQTVLAEANTKLVNKMKALR